MSPHAAHRDLTSGKPWDCGDPDCDICEAVALDQRPGESRAAWLSRLTRHFRAAPLALLQGKRLALSPPTPIQPRPLLVDCARCGEPRLRERACEHCRRATMARRRPA